MTDGGVVVYERDRQYKDEVPEGLELYDERKYGNFSCASYYCVKSENDIERLLERIDYINANN